MYNCPPDGAFGLRDAGDVAIDTSGNVYVTRNDNTSHIVKLDSAGNMVSSFGPYGTGNAEFKGARGIAVDSSNSIYVIEGTYNKVKKFNSDGTFVLEWDGSAGAGGQLSNPADLAVDSSGNILVVDTNNNRIQKFNSSGVYQSDFGSNGTGDGQFSYPSDLTVDSSGNIYVADTDNHRIQKFNSSGVYQSQFGSNGTGDGQFSYPRGITIDSADNIYVADTSNNRIQKFNSSHVFQTEWGSSASSYGSGPGEMSGPRGITHDSSNNIYVADQYNNRVQKFTSAGSLITQFGTSGLSSYGGYEDSYGNGGSGNNVRFYSPAGTAIDNDGNTYVSDQGNNRIMKFNSSGNFVSQIASSSVGSYGEPSNGSNNGEFDRPAGMVTDASNNLYVADFGNNRIQKFNSSGAHQLSFGGNGPYGGGSGDGQLMNPMDVALDGTGNIYVADLMNDRLQKFDSGGNYLTKTSSAVSSLGGVVSVESFGDIQMLGGVDASEAGGPVSVAVGPDGNVWALTYGKLLKYSTNLEPIQNWDISNSFTYMSLGVRVDKHNNVYVGQFNDGGPGGRLLKFDSSGNQVGVWDDGYRMDEFMPVFPASDPEIDGRLAVSSMMQNKVVFLCDTDVSTNNCSGPNDGGGNSGGGEESSTYFYNNSSNDSITYLIAPDTATNFSLSGVDYASLQKDGSNLFPAGLTSFNFDATPNSATTITIYYDLPGAPTGYTARKYNPANQTYADIPGATITREDYSGKSRLKLTYSITDNGPLDQDPTPGHVVDPVGLATTSAFLASTGLNFWLYVVGAISLLGAGSYLVRQYSRR